MGKDSETFADKLRDSAQQTGSIICMGYDPAPVKYPQEGISGYFEELPDPTSDYDGKEVQRKIDEYFDDTLSTIIHSDESPGAIKPNLGYFIMYDDEKGYWGSEALKKILSDIEGRTDIPIILDAKDADIGRSSASYASSKFKMNIDAMTVHPEMGSDSIKPFLDTATLDKFDINGRGVYILTRTSNPGARETQDLDTFDKEKIQELLEEKYGIEEEHLEEAEDYRELVDVLDNDSMSETKVRHLLKDLLEETLDNSKKVYERWAENVVDLHEEYPGTVGAVVGATSPEELGEITYIFHDESTKGDIPLLIPGVGTQGGTVEEVMDILEDVGYDLGVVRINSSSGTMFRAQKDNRKVYRIINGAPEHSIATVEEVGRMNDIVRGSELAEELQTA